MDTSNMLSKRKARTQRVCTVGFHLYDTLEKPSLIYSDRKHIIDCGADPRIEWDRVQGTFLG